MTSTVNGMSLAVDAREFSADRMTGIGRHLAAILRELAAGPGPALSLILEPAGQPPADLAGAPNIRAVRMPARSGGLGDQWLLPRLVEETGAALLFSPYYKTPLRGRFRRIITVHDVMFLRLREASFFRRWAGRRLLAASCARTDLIFVDSAFTGDDLAALLPGISDRIRVVYPRLEPAWLAPATAQTAAVVRTRHTGGDPFLLYVGNFKPHKNVDALVRAFAALRRGGQAGGRRLVLAGGDAANTPRIMRLIRALGMNDGITVIQAPADSDLRGLYGAADWFVSASTYEGFGYPFAEAMGCDCPVMHVPVTASHEIVAGAGYPIADPTPDGIADALLRAFRLGKDDRRFLVSRGRTRARFFADQHPGRALLETAGQLLAPR